jgi:hypothetical protein
LNIGTNKYKFDYERINPLISNVIRFGDIDLDGHSDIVFNIQTEVSQKTSTYSIFLKNKDCNPALIKEIESKYPKWPIRACRDFSQEDFQQELSRLSNPASFLTAFFDWGEMG